MGEFKPKNVTKDIWFEIFLRLPFESVFKFMCVSKVWFSTLTDPIFIRNWCRINNLSLPWTLVGYGEDCCSPAHYSLRRMFTYMHPYSHSPFIITSTDTYDGLSFSFLNLFDETKAMYLLGSSNGLVLCATVIKDDFSMIKFVDVTYYVCNPLTKEWVILPPPPTKSKKVWHCFTCNDECISASTNFQVVRIPMFCVAKKFHVEIFSSDLGEWNIYQVCAESFISSGHYNSHLVIHNGVMYWLIQDMIMLVCNLKNNTSIGNNQCTLIKLPAQNESCTRRQCLGVSEGMIRYGTIEENDIFYGRSEVILKVWVLNEEEEWHLLHKDTTICRDMLSEIADLLEKYHCKVAFRVLAFNLIDQDMVILGSEKHAWSYNIRTKESKRFCRYFNQPPDRWCAQKVLPFVLNPRPTKLPPASWLDNSKPSS